MFRIWNMLTLIEEAKEKFQISSDRKADNLVVSDATLTLAGLSGSNRVSGLDIEIHDDLPLGEYYLTSGKMSEREN